jgi:type IV pilus modification protein PilV
MSRGFSLIEALVALAVLSLGLLGAAGMLLNSLRDQSLALRHTAAGALVADMADRIRANPAARELYDTGMSRAAAENCDEAAPCDRARLAAHDLAAFEAGARALLPNQDPRVSITFAPAIGPAAPDRYSLALRWRDVRDPDATDEVTLTLLAQSPVAGTA